MTAQPSHVERPPEDGGGENGGSHAGGEGASPAARRPTPPSPLRASTHPPARWRAELDARDRAVAEESRAVLAKHARSFRIAAKALGPDQTDDAAVCYAFCRAADDAVDEAPSLEAGRIAIDELEDEVRGRRPPRPLVTAWLRVALRRRIPLGAGRALLDAIRTDVGAVRLQTDTDLMRYAYGVAGTVGLQMCGVLGNRDPRALPYAVDLGLAMQLTNIARDVAEDAGRDRVYLPAERLLAVGVRPEAVIAGTADPTATFGVVSDLLDLAERYYQGARDGLRYLPLRGKLTVLLALHLYRAIGRKVARRGAAALKDRTTLSPVMRSLIALCAMFELAHPRTWGILAPAEGADHGALAGLPGTRSEGTCPTA